MLRFQSNCCVERGSDSGRECASLLELGYVPDEQVAVCPTSKSASTITMQKKQHAWLRACSMLPLCSALRLLLVIRASPTFPSQYNCPALLPSSRLPMRVSELQQMSINYINEQMSRCSRARVHKSTARNQPSAINQN